MGDVCIDIFARKQWVYYDLDEYLNGSYSKLKYQHEINGETCQPILNHISPSSGHLVEHLSVLSYNFMDYSNITDCIDYKKIQFKEEFNFMIFELPSQSWDPNYNNIASFAHPYHQKLQNMLLNGCE